PPPHPPPPPPRARPGRGGQPADTAVAAAAGRNRRRRSPARSAGPSHSFPAPASGTRPSHAVLRLRRRFVSRTPIDRSAPMELEAEAVLKLLRSEAAELRRMRALLRSSGSDRPWDVVRGAVAPASRPHCLRGRPVKAPRREGRLSARGAK